MQQNEAKDSFEGGSMVGRKLAKGLRVCAIILMILEAIGALTGSIILFCTRNSELILAGLGVLFGGGIIVVTAYYLLFAIAYNTEKLAGEGELESEETPRVVKDQPVKDNQGSKVKIDQEDFDRLVDEDAKDTRPVVCFAYVSNVKKKYDIKVLVDDEVVATLTDDDYKWYHIEEGNHKFSFESVDDPTISTTMELLIKEGIHFVINAKSDRIKVDVN